MAVITIKPSASSNWEDLIALPLWWGAIATHICVYKHKTRKYNKAFCWSSQVVVMDSFLRPMISLPLQDSYMSYTNCDSLLLSGSLIQFSSTGFRRSIVSLYTPSHAGQCYVSRV